MDHNLNNGEISRVDDVANPNPNEEEVTRLNFDMSDEELPLMVSHMIKCAFTFNCLVRLLREFEAALAGRLEELELRREGDLNLEWMHRAMETICDIHKDFRAFLVKLQYSPAKFDMSWINEFVDDTRCLLELSVAFNFERTTIDEIQFYSRYIVHLLNNCEAKITEEKLNVARAALEEMLGHAAKKLNRDARISACSTVIQNLVKRLQKDKGKQKEKKLLLKEQVLQKALHGLKACCALLCYALVSAFLPSKASVIEIHALGPFLWSSAFMTLQHGIHREVRGWTEGGVTDALQEVVNLNAAAKDMLISVEMLEAEIAQGSLVAPIQGESEKGKWFNDKVEVLRQSHGIVSKCGIAYRSQLERFFNVIRHDRGALLERLSDKHGIEIDFLEVSVI